MVLFLLFNFNISSLVELRQLLASQRSQIHQLRVTIASLKRKSLSPSFISSVENPPNDLHASTSLNTLLSPMSASSLLSPTGHTPEHVSHAGLRSATASSAVIKSLKKQEHESNGGLRVKRSKTVRQ